MPSFKGMQPEASGPLGAILHMKVLAYIPLHYGADYLKYAIQSVYPVVDEILILYTSTPSHGLGSDSACPESRETLQNEAWHVDDSDKITWHNGVYRQENHHRNAAFDYARRRGFDVVVALDSDELWETEILRDLIQETYDRKAGKCLVWMRHLWRSFNWICDDPMRQERIYYIGSDRKEELFYADKPKNQVWHFGYARSFADVDYKISIHGHSREWTLLKNRWFDEKYKPFPPVQDVHPTCVNTWNPKPFDRNELPEIMRTHPWFNSESIQ